MATINFDASSKFGGAASNPTTWSHTCTGTNRGLIVAVFITNSATVTGVTYAGTAMTLVGTSPATASGTEHYYLYKLENPASGANNISVTPSSTTSVGIGAIAQSWTGVNQTNMIDSFASDSNTHSAASSFPITVTPTISPTRGFWFPREYSGNTTGSGGTNTTYVDKENTQSGFISMYSTEQTGFAAYNLNLNFSSSLSTFFNIFSGTLAPSTATVYATKFAATSSQYAAKTSGVTGLPTGSSAFTWCAWVTFSSLPTSGNYNGIFQLGVPNGGSPTGWDLYLTNTSGTLKFGLNAPGIGEIGIASFSFVASVKYYLAVTYDGTTVKTYVNNELVNSGTGTLNTTAGGLYIGDAQFWPFYGDNAQYDVRMYNKACSQAELLSNASGATTTTGLVGRWCINNTLNDALGTNNLTASTSAPTFTTSNTYVPVTALGITGFSQSGSPLLTGLRAYYKATDLTDASGNGYTLTNNNSATVNPTGGKVDGAFDFGSANTNKSMTIASQLGLAKNDARSYLWWVQITTAPTSGNIGVMLATEYTTGAVGYSMDYWNSSGTLKTRTGRFKDTINDPTLIVTETFTTATWVQCAYTFDGTTEFFYVGGVLMGTNAPGTADGTGTALPNEFSIGKNAYGRYLSGLMSAIAAHSRAVSYDEILTYYNNGAGIPWVATVVNNQRRRMLIFMPS